MTSSYEIILIALIPFISGIVGWGTNVVALQMTFLPLEWWPTEKLKPFIGWQGIIPMKAKKMAEKSVDLITSELLTVSDVFSLLEPREFTMQLMPALVIKFREIVDAVAMRQIPTAWPLLPATVKEEILNRVLDDIPDDVEAMIRDLNNNIEDVFDLKAMVVGHLTANKQLLNRMFLECGREEFAFIKRSGFYFGFLFGLAQMTLFIFYDRWWILPAAGFVVGYLTNFLAMKMIFYPINPKRVGCFTFHGLFLQRQWEVAEVYGRIVSADVLSATNLLQALTTGPRAPRMKKLMRDHINHSCARLGGSARWAVDMVVGKAEMQQITILVQERMLKALPETMMTVDDWARRTMALDVLLREKMRELSSAKFEGMLHPVFQEDEWKLILVGAVLGLIVGFVQAIPSLTGIL